MVEKSVYEEGIEKGKKLEKDKSEKLYKIYQSLADRLITKYDFKTVYGDKSNDCYVYQDGIYVKTGKKIIEIEVEKSHSYFKTHNVNEVIKKIGRMTAIDRDDIGNPPEHLVCLINGVLNLKTLEIKEHDSKYGFMNKFPIRYKKAVDCPKLKDFFHEVFQEDDLRAIQEWFGYLLLRNYAYKKAIILRGPKDTGKTTFLLMMERFVGRDNISGVELQSLAQGKWYLARLYNKYANICDDLSEKDIYDVGTFKKITGRSPVDGEFKHGDQFQFSNFAKLVFATNKIPYIKTDVDDDAYWNRWMIFDFDNIFDEKNSNTNKNIVDDICDGKELSGLLNWAIVGLKRLEKQKFFSYKREWKDNRNIMQSEFSNVAKFIQECLVGDDSADWVSKEGLYLKYKEYSELNDMTVQTKHKFGLDFRNYCNFAISSRDNTGKMEGYKNLRIANPLPIFSM